MRKLLFILFLVPFLGNSQTKPAIKNTTLKVVKIVTQKTTIDIAGALKEALNRGITEQVSKLAIEDGFYKNDEVKIMPPIELIRAEKVLRKIGYKDLAEDGIRMLNRSAEDAVKQATPIFATAINDMTVQDAKEIVMGAQNAATMYLQTTTTKDLYDKFLPVVKESMERVGANAVWSSIIEKYNDNPFVAKINPNIADYVTNRALDGVFFMITKEEKNIRTKQESRTSDLLKTVFAMQDKDVK